MKQVYQSMRTGETAVADVPAPKGGTPGMVLVDVAASLVSAGTERMIVQFAEKNLLNKVRARPDLARQMVEKMRREGLVTALQTAFARLDQPMALGYSVAGTVIDAGADTPFKPGDRVACAGGGQAVHAEIVSVPKNLVVPIADNVPFDAACFATLGAIALQGIRLAEIELGETVAVIGLGLLGQLSVQMLRAAGCRVVGMDIDGSRAALARKLGAVDTATTSGEFGAVVTQQSHGRGADAVLITADTPSNEPLELAATIARDRAIVVAVGAVGLQVPRKAFFEKELDLRISRSYGPGRYDPEYESKGHDYPFGYVRWTEQRNLDAVVQMIADRQLDVDALISHRFDIADAPRAFDLVTGRTAERFLAVLLEYPGEAVAATSVQLPAAAPPAASAAVTLGVLGAGTFATATLLPILAKLPDLSLVVVGAGSGLSAQSVGAKYKFRRATTDETSVFTDATVNTVAILTRHRLHARQVVAALDAGKHVFVEKPLCLSPEELTSIDAARQRRVASGATPQLMVGFNRRFAPFVKDVRDILTKVREPLVLHYRANAGFIPATHWTQDPFEGGRLIGEACHFIDLLLDLANSPALRVTTRALPNGGRYSSDNVVVSLELANGSIATVTYVANGNKSAGKEMLEVFGGGVVAHLDDYRRLTIHHADGLLQRSAWLRQDKGHRGEWESFVGAIRTGKDAMSYESIRRSMLATFAAHDSLLSGEPVECPA